MNRDSQFSLYKITNGHILFEGEEKSKGLGCTGELEVETEVKEVSKNCEGVVKETLSKVTALKLKFTGHVEKDVLRDVFGVSNKGLKPGVYSYGINSKGKKSTLTFDAYDLYETDTLLLAFPICASSSGLQYSIKNGEDEVAEIELEFTCSADENGNFYYEAFGSEAVDVKEKWHEKFEPKNMTQGA